MKNKSQNENKEDNDKDHIIQIKIKSKFNESIDINKSFMNRKRFLDESPKNKSIDKKNIKSIKLNEDKISNKLVLNELIFKNCCQITIQKLKNLKNDDINEIHNIISYNNTNLNIIYFCFKKIKKI